MNVEIHSRVLDSLIGLFDVPLIQNDLRGLYAEHLIAELLGDEWNAVGSAWAGWDLEHEDGTKIEVKSSAAKQSWEPSKNGKSLPAFNIKASKFHWRDGSSRLKSDGRLAQIYIFAWHGNDTKDADQWDADQWEFFVVPTDMLPDQKSISLGPLKHLVRSVKHKELLGKVDNIRMGLTDSVGWM